MRLLYMYLTVREAPLHVWASSQQFDGEQDSQNVAHLVHKELVQLVGGRPHLSPRPPADLPEEEGGALLVRRDAVVVLDHETAQHRKFWGRGNSY